MRVWLTAKAEEDRRRQEEERTRQESYRLEQRRMEHEILRTSLQGGIPPPLVPVVFAGMGGGALSPAAVDWAQQFMALHTPQQHPPALLPPSAVPSSDQQRQDSQTQGYGQYPVSGGGVPSTPSSAQGPPSAYMPGYPGSPTRPRTQSVPGGAGGRPLAGAGGQLPNLNTNVPGGGSSHQPQQSQSQEAQASPSIYFHHWQPPATQAGGRGGSDQPAAPSVGESPRKRKAPGSQQPQPPPSSSNRHRSPPFLQSTGLSNPPPGRRRAHSRQRSDLSSYRPGPLRGRAESLGPGRELSPMPTSGANSTRDSGESSQAAQHQAQAPQFAPSLAQVPSGRTGAHSVSSLLSDDPHSPRPATHFTSSGPSESRHRLQQQQQQQQQQHRQHMQPQQHGQPHFPGLERAPSPRSLEEKLHGSGGMQGPAATRPGGST
ncbi:uncharacterized protein C8A04DRAFT_12786 [Dichotomopilus funicola]|uniref:Uncharacterized protein n=1 Tax=Dichotomopilus funicola TaxID=1934379 RepID=A0AAN6ZMW9_9PEZI|nr:hypothetical protein C8A04DRAFT_12786 [Dichotomopilus funicola]